MSRLSLILGRLREGDDPSIDTALAAALPTADPAAAFQVVALLLERGQPEGHAGLVRHYHLLPPDARQLAQRHAGELQHAIRTAGASANAIRLIREGRLARLAHVLVDQLAAADPALREEAGHGLIELAEAYASDPRGTGAESGRLTDAAAARCVQAAVEEAVVDYRRHQHPAALLALALLCPRPLPAASAALDNLRHPAVEPMRRLLRHSEHPAVRRALVALAGVPALADAALQGLAQAAQTGPAWGDLLASTHLLLDRRLAAVLRKLDDPAALLPAAAALKDVPADAARGLVRWVEALPLEADQRVEALARLRGLGDGLARLAALRRLIELAGEVPDAHGAIADFASDAEPAVARLALRHLIRANWPGLPRLLPRLVNSPHESIRTLASQELAPLGFARLWEAWPRLGEAQRLAAGGALIKIDPHFHRQLSDKLARPDRPARLRALGILHALNQGALFEEALIALAQGRDEVVAASAVRALGSASSPRAVAALEAALDSPDSRVRANAVEALRQLQSVRHVQKLLDMARHDAGRPRANAIQALLALRTADALGALANMLADPRPAQRTSALWLVETMGLLDVARQVAELSLADPDRKVRQRAQQVVGRLVDPARIPAA